VAIRIDKGVILVTSEKLTAKNVLVTIGRDDVFFFPTTSEIIIKTPFFVSLQKQINSRFTPRFI